jgi:hypothetical protein
MSEQTWPTLTAEASKQLDDLLVTTETLGYQKGKLDTIKRINLVLEETRDVLNENKDPLAAEAIVLALKVINAIYVS